MLTYPSLVICNGVVLVCSFLVTEPALFEVNVG